MSPPPSAVAIPSELPSAGDARAAARGTTVLLALLAVYVVWGSTYLAMRIVVESVPPMLMGACRFTAAGTILLAVGRVRVGRFLSWREWKGAIPAGVLLFVGGNGFVAIGETAVSSGVAAVVVATMPLWMAVIGSAFGERPRGREWLGIAFGVAGVVILMSGAELSAEPTAAIVLACSPLSWALGSTIARRTPQAPGFLAAGAQQLAGGLAMFAASAVRGERWPSAVSAPSAWALVYLIVFGSLVAFSAYAWLLRNTRPAVATSYAFVNPPLAVLLGALVGSEAIGTATLVGTPVIVAAVVLVVGKPRPRR
ncbi:MAG TPA: drug/metabolite exporter YedA [Kofleriaceae bacterium]|nr:drug/metabolite exporter YedA [Kofleriaceae bacterium]